MISVTGDDSSLRRMRASWHAPPFLDHDAVAGTNADEPSGVVPRLRVDEHADVRGDESRRRSPGLSDAINPSPAKALPSITEMLPPSRVRPLPLVSHTARSGRPLPAPRFQSATFSALISALTIGTSADWFFRSAHRLLDSVLEEVAERRSAGGHRLVGDLVEGRGGAGAAAGGGGGGRPPTTPPCDPKSPNAPRTPPPRAARGQ